MGLLASLTGALRGQGRVADEVGSFTKSMSVLQHPCPSSYLTLLLRNRRKVFLQKSQNEVRHQYVQD